MAVQADGKVIVGGDFTSFNNFAFHHLVRLNLDGSVDPAFNADTGASQNGSVHAIVIQPDGRILIGGVFTNVNGASLNHIARLNTDGSVDSSFNVGVGANNTVETLTLDSQGRILLGGQFTRASGVTRNGVTRLNPDGTVDPDINFGAGANGYVRAMHDPAQRRDQCRRDVQQLWRDCAEQFHAVVCRGGFRAWDSAIRPGGLRGGG